MRSNWDYHAQTDPLWAILTDPQMKNRRWDPDAFFESGRRDITTLMRYAASLGVEFGRRRALDFGCGVGRLTRALAGHFEQVYGVDISPSMVALAREYNAHISNCTFIENDDADFRALPAGDFDLIYSFITLQHIPPRHAMRYLRGLMGRLRPGGLFIFQLPGESRLPFTERMHDIWHHLIYRRYWLRDQTAIDVHGVRKQRVMALIERSGCRLLDVQRQDVAGPQWISYRYAVVRNLNPAATPPPDRRAAP
jgi:SAM-dependent methyltransferase